MGRSIVGLFRGLLVLGLRSRKWFICRFGCSFIDRFGSLGWLIGRSCRWRRRWLVLWLLWWWCLILLLLRLWLVLNLFQYWGLLVDVNWGMASIYYMWGWRLWFIDCFMCGMLRSWLVVCGFWWRRLVLRLWLVDRLRGSIGWPWWGIGRLRRIV